MNSERRGLFGIIEGLDGAGTTTQTELLEDYIVNTLGFPDVLAAREPTGNKFYGKVIRSILKGEIKTSSKNLSQLFVLDSVHNNVDIKEVMEQGGIALLDRYRPSSFAYQGLTVSQEYLNWIHEREGDLLEIPDFGFYLDVSGEMATERFESRLKQTGTREIFEELEIQNQIEQRYHEIIQQGLKYFGKQIIVIDASKSIEAVAKEIQEKFTPIYEAWISGTLDPSNIL